jgi:uncharacterized caspase-like protein
MFVLIQEATAMYPARTSHAAWVVMTLMILAATPATGQEPAEAQQGKNRALLVACQNYPKTELNPLRYAHNDVLAFKEALLHTGFSEGDITLLYDPQKPKQKEESLPKAANIRAQLQKLRNGGEVNTLVVALSGHGVQFDRRNYFCPVDADLRDRNTLIDLIALYEALSDCPAQHKLLLVDACRNNPFPEGARSPGRPLVDLGSRVEDVPQGIAALFSCSPGEKSWEDPFLRSGGLDGHGIFFHHLVEAWNGAAYDSDEKLTLGKLFEYAATKTTETAQKSFTAVQRPQQKALVSGAWDLWKGHVGERRWPFLREHRRPVASVAFCSDERALSGSLDDTMLLWDLKSGKVLQRFKGPQTVVATGEPITTMVYSVAVSPTGIYALSGSSDGDNVLRLWDLRDG